MILNVCLFFLVNVFSLTIINALPYARYRRQLYLHKKSRLPYGGWEGGSNNPSGGSPGAYYGTGSNPNYGHFKPNYNGYSSNSDWNQQQQQQQQQQNYMYNNNNNRWWEGQNAQNYYNRYSSGNQGWYGAGNNYWYNKGQSLIPSAWLFITSILISINCI